MGQKSSFNEISPLFICLGFPKCATTWIHRQLEEHPEIGCTTTKEVTYWTKNYSKGHDWYLSHFPEDKSYKVFAEVTPHYMDSVALARLAENLEGIDVKFMVCLRNPCHRTYSHYHDVTRAGRTSGSFQHAVEAIPELLNQSLYGQRIIEFLQHFPRESLHIGYYEDIKKAPNSFMQEVYRFMGVNESFAPENSGDVVNPGRSANRFDVLLKKLEMTSKRIGLKRQHLVDIGIWKYIDAFYRKLARSRPLPQLEGENLDYIRQVLAEDVRVLEKLGVDVAARWPDCKILDETVN